MRITQLQIIYQAPVGVRARKDITRRTDPTGPYRNRIQSIPADVETGIPGANVKARALIIRAYRPRKDERFWYATANFENDPKFWRTIVPRSEIS